MNDMDELRQAHDEWAKARVKLERAFFRAFPVGALVSWVINGRAGQYGQFGTVVENEGRHCIFVVNNKTQRRIRFDAESAHGWKLKRVNLKGGDDDE